MNSNAIAAAAIIMLSSLAHFTPTAASISFDLRHRSLDPQLALAEANRIVITVRKDGTGNFRTVTDAVQSIPRGNVRRTIIKIGPGVYREKLRVESSKPFVTFLGDPTHMPTIAYGGTALENNGTYNSSTVAVESNYFVASNIIFHNTAPMPQQGGKEQQGVAMRIAGNKAAFHKCRFYGYQDTLYDERGLHFFHECVIRGTVDFIFGNGRSLYLGCTMESVFRGNGVTALTAHGRSSPENNTGFSFVNCKVVGTGSAYLGRSWGPWSRVVFAFTYMGAVVNPERWNDWDKRAWDKTVFYGEYKCSGPGSRREGRVSYGKVLTYQEARPFLTKGYIRANSWLRQPPSF